MAFLLSCDQDGAVDRSTAATILDVPYGNVERQKVDVYLPAGRGEKTPLVLMFHGGGWVMGDRKDNSTIAKKLQKLGIASMSIGYRLVDTTTHTSAPEISADIRSGVAKALELRTRLGITQGKVGMFGISAGGHLALLYAYAYDSLHVVQKVIAYAGPSNLDARQLLAHPNMALMVYKYLDWRPGGKHLDVDLWNPIHYVDSLSPSTLLIHGSKDTTVDPSQSRILDSVLHAHHVDSHRIVIDSVGHPIDSTTLVRVVDLIANEMR